jgi:hypothetical protein
MIISAETVHGSPLKLVISGRDPFLLETIVVATSAVHLQNDELCLKSIGPDVYSLPTGTVMRWLGPAELSSQ